MYTVMLKNIHSMNMRLSLDARAIVFVTQFQLVHMYI